MEWKNDNSDKPIIIIIKCNIYQPIKSIAIQTIKFTV